ncbi:MAG TPA: hypothetical protein VFI42_18250 [Thermomicrobiaceae bacterium]|nr:hypothetical protein [Thermomicrobiaceae bacterium]
MDDRIDDLARAILAGEAPPGAGVEVAAWPAPRRRALLAALSQSAPGRRWLRGELLPRLPGRAAAALAARLIGYPADFSPTHRDRTTPRVVAALSLAELRRQAPFLAGGNAASALWERLRDAAPASLAAVARGAMARGSALARETTLTLLLLDPDFAGALTPPERRRLLAAALQDAAEEVRGLAGELTLDHWPERLVEEGGRWRRDSSERLRMASWDAAFALEPARAAEEAAALLADESAPLEARRSALVALGSALPTREVAPLLALAVTHPEPLLAQDAANLLWSFHRAPVVAEAAARSPHEGVRAIAERLLHPEHGSPAAGGSRPGAPSPSDDLYEQFRRELERERE